MAYYRNNTRKPQSRWMNLKFAGTCKVCSSEVAAGDHAFYDAGTRTITCYSIACCEADGLTSQVWSGSPVDGKFVASRTATRMGRPYTPAN